MKKRMLSLLIAGMLLFGSALAVPGTRVGFEVLDMLYEPGENCVLSPVSLAYALSMAAQGADGETLRQMLALLDADSAAEIAGTSQALEQSGLTLANAAFITGDLVPKAQYTKSLQELFDAEWFENKGDMVQKINRWVQKHTDGMIDQIISGPLPENSALMLLNAVFMDAEWAQPFSASATSKGMFHAADGDVQVDFMYQKAWFSYAERDGVQLLRKTYAGKSAEAPRLSMLIALPEAGGVDKVIEGLKAEGLGYFCFPEGSTEVRLTLPKMDVSAEYSLRDVLIALGMADAFSDTADFSGISDIPLFIGDVRQKVRVQVDEEGTRAAAVTAVSMMAGMAMPKEPPVEMCVDRPFVFLIVDEGSQSICFAGVVEDPSK